MWLNMPFEAVDDNKGVCRDVSYIGHAGNGDVEIKIIADMDIEYLIELAMQALLYQLEA